MRHFVLLLGLIACGAEPVTDDVSTDDVNTDDGSTDDGIVTVDEYACGWEMNNPGTLASNGGDIGDIVGELTGTDQCGDTYNIWDGHGAYMMLVSVPMW